VNLRDHQKHTDHEIPVSGFGDNMSLTELTVTPWPAWQAEAACIGATTTMYPNQRHPAAVQAAQKICRYCPVKRDCLEYALANNEPDGIWGGLTTLAREQLAARRRAT
jgi:hypothetical protein